MVVGQLARRAAAVLSMMKRSSCFLLECCRQTIHLGDEVGLRGMFEALCDRNGPARNRGRVS